MQQVGHKCSYSQEAEGDDASPCLLSPFDLVQVSSSGNDVTHRGKVLPPQLA